MHKVILMHVVDSHCDIVKYFPGMLFVQTLILRDSVEEFRPLAQLADDVNETLVLEVLVSFHDVRMILSQ